MGTSTLGTLLLSAFAGASLTNAIATPDSTPLEITTPVPVVQPLQLAQTGDGESNEGAEPTVADIVAGVQAFYDGVEAYHADFVQTYENVAIGEGQEAAGHVYFLKPGRMRWDYTGPQEKYLISDGEILWIYEPEFQQAARLNLAESDLPTAVRFLMGEGELSGDFDIEQRERCDEGRYCLELTPIHSEGQYRQLRMVVDADTYQVHETVVIDPIGNTNRFVFANMRTTDPLPAENFEFEPPEGTRVLNP
ncbi:MAG: outer membrane lipoprotein chaperone LolA [Myxococcales bacterium]|nr:outer membrane lipoprotein chaperone LolA [Myxococcales bacterium]